MHWTGKIVPDSPDLTTVDDYMGPPTELIPDQDAQPYCRMLEGPVQLLEWVAKFNFAEALWAGMRKSEFYHLFIQRLLRWIAREQRSTRDDKAIGRKA